ncbi:hypothetical protein GCM10023333_04750 [Ferrimonas pelagia]|uniref:Phosphoesterase n=2 Tax=Ferrimonas pelagia TaxID=1177826 RepID=A0ABP9EH94_9GAMM
MVALALAMTLSAGVQGAERQWLAGDHHAHTHWSVSWDKSTDPWSPVKGGDSPHSYLDNAQAAKRYGLAWLVNTDHGGPQHSQLLDKEAYPELLAARQAVPEVHQYFGIELDVPAGEHATVMVPINADEREVMVTFQRDFSIREDRSLTRQRNTVEHLQAGIRYLGQQQEKALIIKNHPSRQATGLGEWARVTPEKLKIWHETDPEVFVGMVAAPGHQGGTDNRGSYYKSPTLNGFDQMTAVIGGPWDHLLGSGQKFWISAGSDCHIHVSDEGRDFWPGEYTKTYVYARNEPADIMDALRHGRSFMVFGDLINGLDLSLRGANDATASLGQSLSVGDESELRLSMRISLPEGPNFNGDRPELKRIDIITGAISEAAVAQADRNSTTQVSQRLYPQDWQVKDGHIELTVTLPREHGNGYVRLRGTSGEYPEPQVNEQVLDPWQDLWFYTNPIFWQGS